MCCDEAAAIALGDRVVYAKVLSHLAAHVAVTCQPAWALGIGGSKMVLFERIRNVLGLGATGNGRWYGASCAAVGAVAASAVWGAVLIGTGSQQVGKPVAAENEYAVPFGDPEDRVFQRAFADHVARHPELLEAPRKHWNAQTQRFMFDKGVNSNVEMAGAVENAPSELNKALLPSYTIEPPDILMIRLAKIEARKGTTLTQDLNPIGGEYLVSPDGRVNLGFHGQVQVAGLTLEEAEMIIETHLAERLESPDVSVEVQAYNSKVYYVITPGKEGDVVTRLPITGNETVLDALSQVNGVDRMQEKRIWIARPQPGGGATDAILQVNWQEITRGAATATNYQVLPGDRIFVQETPFIERAAQGAQKFLEKARAAEQTKQQLEFFIGEEY
jgi:protein involved in polysaccharide export with SLBB domain